MDHPDLGIVPARLDVASGAAADAAGEGGGGSSHQRAPCSGHPAAGPGGGGPPEEAAARARAEGRQAATTAGQAAAHTAAHVQLNDVAQYMVPPRFLVGVPVPLGMEQRLWHKAMQAAAAAAMAAIWQPGVLPRGFSCAGTEAAITALKEFAEKAGAPKANILKTGGAFHTSMMQPAQDKQGKVLDDLAPTMKPPRATVYMNSTAGPIKPDTSPKEIVTMMMMVLMMRMMGMGMAMMMMMAVKVEVPGQTTATGNILVDSSDTVASSSGRDQAIIIITITATTIIVIINVIAIAIANIIITIVIIIIGRYGRWS